MADEEFVELKLEPTEFARVMREVKTIDKALATEIRKSIRDAAKLVIGDVQSEIRAYPARRQTGMREQLASSMAVRIGTAKGGTKQGVFIVSTGRLLPANKKALVKALNRAQFRHPVFPNKKQPGSRAWVDQPGIRYFRQSIVAKRESHLTAVLTAATEKAAKAVDG
jgi:hypothetical protein